MELKDALIQSLAGTEIAPVLGEVIPYRGEFATVWEGYKYPFHTQKVAGIFLALLRSGEWNALQLELFERY